MLGRREEELEREEVERQLRDAEMQERHQAEAEEAERQAQHDAQRAREEAGEDVGEGERDLDEDVPDMDAQVDLDEGESEVDEEEDDVEMDGSHVGWVYDTTRDPDTESEEEPPEQRGGLQRPSRARLNSARRALHEHAEAEAAAQAMLNQDGRSSFDDEYDLDDDIPDQDHEARNLDSDIPDAADDDGGWEHTDTELDESDMDISIMPPGATAHHLTMQPPSSNMSQRYQRNNAPPRTTSQPSDANSSLRRASGNIPLPMAPPAPPASSHPPRRGLPRTQHLPPHYTPDQLGSDFSVSALMSSGDTAASLEDRGGTQRGWLDPATARRNLFGVSRNTSDQPGNSTGRSVNGQTELVGATRQVSSGGLFTPPSQSQQAQQPVSRTRSGRVLGGRGRGRRG